MENNNCEQAHCSTSKSKSNIAGLLTPVVILAIYALYLRCKGRLRSQSVHDIEAANSTAQRSQRPTKSGLDKSTLESYPVSVVGDQEPEHDHEGQTCPICLLDYQPKEIMKTLPGCLHRFHADCIDQWLCSDATCPICRASPPRRCS
ncbi:hypothetical protein V2J09_002101 [Rumex salicifolius]